MQYSTNFLKKIAGVLLIFAGFVGFLLPFVPGTILVILGIEVLGMRLLFQEKFTALWQRTKKK